MVAAGRVSRHRGQEGVASRSACRSDHRAFALATGRLQDDERDDGTASPRRALVPDDPRDRPSLPGRGVGTALVEPMSARADEIGVPTFLETQTESNLAYYQRFGFEFDDTFSVDASPPLWQMQREPRPAGLGSRHAGQRIVAISGEVDGGGDGRRDRARRGPALSVIAHGQPATSNGEAFAERRRSAP